MKTFVFLVLIISALRMEAADGADLQELADKARSYCDAGDIEGIKSLYYFEGTPATIVDQEIYSWEMIIDEIKAGRAEYYDSEYHTLDDYLKRPDVATNLKMHDLLFRPITMNGTTYSPNLKVVGVLAVRFRMGRGIGGGLRPVGLAPDGSLRFVAKKIEPLTSRHSQRRLAAVAGLNRSEKINSVFDILTTGLVSAIIVGPSISFLVWLVIRLKRHKDQMRTRILSSLKIVSIALFGCILVGLISRALETSSDSYLLVSMSMISGYAYYIFIALNIVLFSLLVIVLPFTKSNA